MTLRGDGDDTSAGRTTQGGDRDSVSPGPHRRSGNSFWWFAVLFLVAAAVLVAVLSTHSRKDAPAEHDTVPVSGESGPSRAVAPAGAAATVIR